MGLDIGIYTNKIQLKNTNNIDIEEGDYIDPSYNGNFVLQTGTLNINKLYSGKNEYSFRAGSYKGYGEFRRSLYYLLYDNDTKIEDYWDKYYKLSFINISRLFKLKRIDNEKIKYPIENLPFFEILYFSDCEGIIDSIVCNKLHKDFSNYREDYHKKYTKQEYWINTYDSFMDAFELSGKNNGIIKFC